MYRSRLLETVVVNRCLIVVLAVALVVRLALAVAIQAQVDRPPAKLCLIPGDAEGYWELAQHIVAQEDYAIYQPPRYVLRVPGFPALLAMSQWIFGARPFAARCLLACVGTGACGLTYWLGRELADRTTALLAAAYTALSPTLALFSVLILSETAFAATLLLSLIAIARVAKCLDGRLETAATAALVAGCLIGVATLVRPTWMYVGLAIALAVLFFKRGNNVRKAICLTGIVLCLCLTMAPWTLRNYFVTGRLVPTTLWVGASLYDGLNPTATGDSDMQFIETDQLPQRLSEYEVDREYRRRAWDFAVQHPWKTALLAVKKQQRYWSLVPNAGQFQDWRLQAVVCLTALPLFIFAIGGLWRLRRDLVAITLTAAPVLLFAALHLLFVGSLRYRLPAEYPFAVLAAVGVSGLLNCFRRQKEVVA